MRQLSTLAFEGGAKITGLPDAVAAQEPATLAQLNAAIEGMAWKDDVKVATSSNVNLSSPGSSLDGISMTSGDRFLARGQTAATENGIYIWNGAAVPASRALDMSASSEFNSAVVPVTQGTDAGTQWRQTAVNPTVGSTNIVFTSFATAAPDASTTTKGIVELATDSETNTGTDTTRAVTPSNLAQWTGKALRYTSLFGDGSATQYDITHNLGTRDCHVQVYEAASPYGTVQCDVSRLNTNTVRLNFSAAVASNELRCVVLA